MKYLISRAEYLQVPPTSGISLLCTTTTLRYITMSWFPPLPNTEHVLNEACYTQWTCFNPGQLCPSPVLVHIYHLLQCPETFKQVDLVQAKGPVSLLMVDKTNGYIVTAVREKIQ